MSISYPFTEWPIILCIGMFLLLVVGLAYGQIVTANIQESNSTPSGSEPDQRH